MSNLSLKLLKISEKLSRMIKSFWLKILLSRSSNMLVTMQNWDQKILNKLLNRQDANILELITKNILKLSKRLFKKKRKHMNKVQQLSLIRFVLHLRCLKDPNNCTCKTQVFKWNFSTSVSKWNSQQVLHQQNWPEK